MKDRITGRTITLLLIFIVLGVYYPAIFVPLNSVDDPGMYNHLLNTDAFHFRDVFIPGGSGTYYRPLLVVSFLMDKFVWGLEESFIHLENIFFHLTNTLLLFAIARRVSLQLKIESPIPSLLPPLFFAIHPINTESVIWISGRTDLLAGLFVFLSSYLLLLPRRNLTSILAAISLLLACLAKDTAIFFLPAAIILPFFWPTEGSGSSDSPLLTVRKNIFHFVIFIVTGAAYFAFRTLAFRQGDLGVKQVMTHVAGSEAEGLLFSLRLVLKAAGFYVKKLFIPFPLNFSIIHISDLYIIVGLLLIVVVLWLLVRRSIPAFFFIAATAIGSSALLVPLLKITWTPLAERYMYMPSAFFLVGITYAAYPWVKRTNIPKVVTMVVACAVIIAIYGTAQRAILWQDNLALYQDCRQKSPGFIPVQNEIANALYSRGKTEEAGRIIKSIAPSENLLNGQFLLISKASALINDGDLIGAHGLLHEALKNPGKHEIAIIKRILKLNGLRIDNKKDVRRVLYPENIKLLSRLYELTGDPFYLYRLGQEHMFHGERVQARETFRQVVSIAPPEAYYVPVAQRLQGKMSN